MAWVCTDLDGTLLDEQGMPTEGAVEGMNYLASMGHRITVYTSRFAPMPEQEKNRLKMQIEQELAQAGFQPMEVWMGTTKPAADIFLGANHVTFDQDWNLALAQVLTMLGERGLDPTQMDPSQADPSQMDPSQQQDPSMGDQGQEEM